MVLLERPAEQAIENAEMVKIAGTRDNFLTFFLRVPLFFCVSKEPHSMIERESMIKLALALALGLPLSLTALYHSGDIKVYQYTSSAWYYGKWYTRPPS